MAKLKQGILGGISGTVGNVVGSSWKGINVVKSKPLSVANPKTAAQTAQRTNFTNAVAFAKSMLTSIVKPLWDRFSVQQSGFNRFISRNIDLFSGTLPDPFANLVISDGKMQAPVINSITNTGSSTVEVTWPTISFSGFELGTDDAYLVLIHETVEIVMTSSADVKRSDGVQTFTDNSLANSGDVIHVYLAFRREDGTIVSQTAYETFTVS